MKQSTSTTLMEMTILSSKLIWISHQSKDFKKLLNIIGMKFPRLFKPWYKKYQMKSKSYLNLRTGYGGGLIMNNMKS